MKQVNLITISSLTHSTICLTIWLKTTCATCLQLLMRIKTAVYHGESLFLLVFRQSRLSLLATNSWQNKKFSQKRSIKKVLFLFTKIRLKWLQSTFCVNLDSRTLTQKLKNTLALSISRRCTNALGGRRCSLQRKLTFWFVNTLWNSDTIRSTILLWNKILLSADSNSSTTAQPVHISISSLLMSFYNTLAQTRMRSNRTWQSNSWAWCYTNRSN